MREVVMGAAINWARLGIGAAFLATAALIAAQLSGWHDFNNNVDAATLGLVLIALVLLLAFIAPRATKLFFERMTTLKLPGGVEVGLQVVSRAERAQGGQSASVDDLRLPEEADEVEVEERPQTGSPREQFQAVRDMLQTRLRFVHTVLFDQSKLTERQYPRVLQEINDEHLLEAEESALVRDVLGGAEDEVELLPYELRAEFLDAAWRFAVRFATLIHEREVRKRMADEGWALIDFEQKRTHRPEFLAYREKVWLSVAARVESGKLDGTRQRLSQAPPPFEAQPVIVLPNKRSPKQDGEYSPVAVLRLEDLLKRTSAEWKPSGQSVWDTPAPE